MSNVLNNEVLISETVKALEARNIKPIVVETSADALVKIKELIPLGASVMNGSSQTLETIGYIDYLKSNQHGWNNLHETILTEQDKAKQNQLRKESVLSDYYLGSVHGLAQTGEFIIASNTGSQLPHIVFTSPNIILVVGINKIVPNLSAAFDRLANQVIPLENERIQKLYGVDTYDNKIVIVKGENPTSGRQVNLIIVKENLGF